MSLLWFCSCPLPAAHDSPLVNFTFESDTVASMPAGWTETSGYDGKTVTAYVTDTTAASGSHSFYMDDWAYASLIVMKTDFPAQSSGVFRMSGSARVEQNDAIVDPFGLIAYSNTLVTTVRFTNDGTFGYVDGLSNLVSTGVSYNVAEWYHFDFYINRDTRTWSFRVEDSSNTEVLAASGLDFATNTYYDFYQIGSWGTSSSDTGQWYIDDVSLVEVSAVPAPSALVLGFFGMAAVLLKRCSALRRGTA